MEVEERLQRHSAGDGSPARGAPVVGTILDHIATHPRFRDQVFGPVSVLALAGGPPASARTRASARPAAAWTHFRDASPRATVDSPLASVSGLALVRAARRWWPSWRARGSGCSDPYARRELPVEDVKGHDGTWAWQRGRRRDRACDRSGVRRAVAASYIPTRHNSHTSSPTNPISATMSCSSHHE
jgi:hypothetical protein